MTRPDPLLRLALWLLALLVALPLVAVGAGWLTAEPEVWRHLAETLLPRLLLNTVTLMAGVGLGVFVVGVGLAWLVAAFDFPGRRWFEVLLMLPLAVPAYVLAFVLLGVFDYTGPVQQWLRTYAGLTSALPSMRSAGGVILTFVLVLYPYVYMLARTAFLYQGRTAFEAARTLGHGPIGAFRLVALPLARPAIAAGLSLALMETLADFGAVAVFNFDTFTTAIYSTWFGLFNLQAAAQLASLLLLVVALTLTAERRLRGNARYETGIRPAAPRTRLSPRGAAVAVSACLLVVVPAFVIPVVQLGFWALGSETGSRFAELVRHTVALGLGATVLTLAGATVIAFARRQGAKGFDQLALGTATLGYALPGSILAVGIFWGFATVDGVLERLFSVDSGIRVLSGSVVALLLAYVIRFLAVAVGPIEGRLAQVRPALLASARTLGHGPVSTFRRVTLPLLRPGLLTAALLVCIDVMKEMPATMLLRPFGWDTLAVRIYELTSEGEWERAALPAMLLILLGLLPVIAIIRGTDQGQRATS